ncbi:hypothetical protein RRG08_013339 [Elysia crispata]|uniref:Uncharacterized protein n=1 Tax=Elysia crispata TaxID=231223 RepID=A0AAE1E6C7_9GAST|nr:hypothetical protein RRG08_013339 [Elysia crispata]
MLHRAQDGISSKLGDAYGWFEHQSKQFKIPETPGLTSLVSFVHRMFDIVHTLQMNGVLAACDELEFCFEGFNCMSQWPESIGWEANVGINNRKLG